MFIYSPEPQFADRLRTSYAAQLRAVARRLNRQQELARTLAIAEEENEVGFDHRLGETRYAEFESTQLHGG